LSRRRSRLHSRIQHISTVEQYELLTWLQSQLEVTI
jgi:hypothetical protein